MDSKQRRKKMRGLTIGVLGGTLIWILIIGVIVLIKHC
jgi:hypothetical protein